MAWQRTALSTMAGSIALGRLTFDSLGLAAVGAMVGVTLLGGWIMWVSRSRYTRHAGLRPTHRPRGGRTVAALAVVTGLLALTELGALLVSGL